MRLKHQADRLGLLWDPEMPWVMKPKLHVSKLEREYLSAHDEDVSGNGPCIEVTYGSNADLVPEHPGDWIPFDSEMSSDPLHFGMDFNQKEYKDFFLERYARCRCRHHQPKENEPKHPRSNLGTSDDFVLEAVKVHRERSESISGIRKEGGSIGSDANIELLHDRPNSEARLSDCQLREDVSPADTGNEISQHNDFKAWDLLFDTVMVLKEGGNAALSIGAISLAAQRYDKAIRYCSIAYLRFPKGHLSFLSPHQDVLLENGGREVRWTPMLKGLVTIRLNLSMVLLRSEVYYPTLACDHARLALLELKPFATSKGSVLTGRKLNKPREGEPEETYTQAKELQAKSYFRLGNAQMVTGDYGAAVKSFDLSIKATKALKGPDAKPEAVVQRRLAEAKKLNARKRKRQRDKFAFAFEQAGVEKNDGNEVDNVG
jgi:tetratricopeptide (TPR) repeat protein